MPTPSRPVGSFLHALARRTPSLPSRPPRHPRRRRRSVAPGRCRGVSVTQRWGHAPSGSRGRRCSPRCAPGDVVELDPAGGRPRWWRGPWRSARWLCTSRLVALAERRLRGAQHRLGWPAAWCSDTSLGRSPGRRSRPGRHRPLRAAAAGHRPGPRWRSSAQWRIVRRPTARHERRARLVRAG